tara:strand:- start:501 stop:767 length:267 start_codon:yes stop_codon:yes gene_type:complete
MEDYSQLRKFIREEIGRNYHTLSDTSYTFEDFQDYNIEIDGSTEGGFYLTVFYKNDKIFPTSMFRSNEDAHHHARMVVDKDRVKRMNE